MQAPPQADLLFDPKHTCSFLAQLLDVLKKTQKFLKRRDKNGILEVLNCSPAGLKPLALKQNKLAHKQQG